MEENIMEKNTMEKDGITVARRIKILLYVVLFSLSSSGVALSQTTTGASELTTRVLSLQECVSIALDDNPTLQAAHFGVRAVEEAAGAAKAPYYPQVGVSAGYHRWDRTVFLPGGMELPNSSDTIGATDEWDGRVYAWYTLYDSGQRRAELLAAKAETQATTDEAQTVRQDIILLTHEAYFRVLEAKANRTAAQDSVHRSEQHLTEAQKRFEAGDVPQADVLRARVDASNAKLDLVRAQNVLRIAHSNLNAAMGLHPLLALTIEERYPEPVAPDNVDLAWALESALQSRPEVAFAQSRAEAASRRIDAAGGKYGPRLKAEGHYGRRDDEFLPEADDWSAGVTLNIPLFTGFERTHRVAEAKALWERSRAQQNQIALEVRKTVVEAFSHLTEAWQTAETTAVMLLDARESLRLIASRYAVNAATMTDLLDAEAALAAAEAKNVAALAGQQITSARFMRAIGEL